MNVLELFSAEFIFCTMLLIEIFLLQFEKHHNSEINKLEERQRSAIQEVVKTQAKVSFSPLLLHMYEPQLWFRCPLPP